MHICLCLSLFLSIRNTEVQQLLPPPPPLLLLLIIMIMIVIVIVIIVIIVMIIIIIIIINMITAIQIPTMSITIIHTVILPAAGHRQLIGMSVHETVGSSQRGV